MEQLSAFSSPENSFAFFNSSRIFFNCPTELANSRFSFFTIFRNIHEDILTHLGERRIFRAYFSMMAIYCQKCGRQYDVTLFQFGRTINCACGERVEFEHQMNLPANTEIKLFADVNVARLVRWLRAASIDTAWEDAIGDADLVRRAITENRHVLTLDKKLPKEWRADNILLLTSERPPEQFAQIVEHFDLQMPDELFTRCLVCNTILRRANAAEIGEKAPPEAVRHYENFQFCTRCDKIYWQGSHTERMRRAIENIYKNVQGRD